MVAVQGMVAAGFYLLGLQVFGIELQHFGLLVVDVDHGVMQRHTVFLAGPGLESSDTANIPRNG